MRNENNDENKTKEDDEKDIAKYLQDWEIYKQSWYNIRGRRLQAEEECSIILGILHDRFKNKAILDVCVWGRLFAIPCVCLLTKNEAIFDVCIS